MEKSAPKLVRRRETANGLIAATLVALVVLGAAFAFWNTRRTLATLQSVDHTLAVRLELEHALVGIIDAETAERGYLLTGKELFLDTFEPSLEQARSSLKALRKATEDNPVQQQRLDRLVPLLAQKIARMREQMKVRAEGGLEASAAVVGTAEGRQLMQEIRGIARQMGDAEDQLLKSRSDAARRASQATLLVVALGSAGMIILMGIATWTTRRELMARKQTAQFQQTARGYAESIVDTVREPLLVLDRDLRVERANRAYYRAFQSTPAETEQRLLSDIGRGQWNGTRLIDALKETLSLDKGFDNMEWEYELHGSRRTMLLNACKLNRLGNHTEAVLLAIEDITERKLAEQALRTSEERFRTIVDSVADYAIFMLDPDGRVTSWNRGAERTKGYKAEEIVGRHFSRFYPAEEITGGQPERDLAEARETGRMEDESWRVRKDGVRFFANVIVSAIYDYQGDLKGYVMITRDITERHRIEQMHVHFRALFDSLPGLYLVMTPDFTIVAVSDAYLKATMTERNGLLGRPLFDIFPDNPNDPEATGETNLRASLDRVLQTGRPDTMAIQRYDVRHPDGTFEERFWSPVNSPVLAADHSIEYLVHRVEDVTDFIKQREGGARGDGEIQNRLDRMEAEIFRSSQQMQDANYQLRAANGELEAFSYSVSHDLRAPLRHIDGFADLLSNHASATLDDKGRRYLKTISDSAKRMGALIDDLLVFSRIGRAEMRRTAVDLNTLTDGVIQDLRMETNGRNVVWERQELPVVEGDSALLRQVLVNLLANAVKYTRPRDPAIIVIGCVKTGTEDTIFVRDNGVGFDMTYVGKLFGVFQRLHRSEEFEGTGIGLANVQRIVVRHGGRVWAEGKSGEGATFSFTLPRAAGSNLCITEPMNQSHDSQS